MKYHVAYQGKVITGIDLEKVQVETDPENDRQILVQIPPVEIQETTVEVGSLKFIFQDGGAKTEDVVTKEAFKACEDQLKQAAAEDTTLLKISRENVETELKALIDPVKNQLLKELEVNYVWQKN